MTVALSLLEQELAAILSEEGGEVVQVLGKILRHGFDSTHPNGGEDNQNLLEREAGDFLAGVALLAAIRRFDVNMLTYHASAKLKRMRPYTHHVPERVFADAEELVSKWEIEPL